MKKESERVIISSLYVAKLKKVRENSEWAICFGKVGEKAKALVEERNIDNLEMEM